MISRWLQLLVHVSIGGRRGHFRHPSHSGAGTYIDIATYISLVRFLRKWGCEQTLSHLCLLFTQALVNQDISRADAFTLGAVADNVSLCVNAMRLNMHPSPSRTSTQTQPRQSRHSHRSSWSFFSRSNVSRSNLSHGHTHAQSQLQSPSSSLDYPHTSVGNGRAQLPLRLEDLKLEHWAEIPPEYIFALGRAVRDDDLEDPARRGEHLETDFKKLLSCATAFFGRPDPALDRLTGEPVFLSCEEAEELDCAESQRVVMGWNGKRASFP